MKLFKLEQDYLTEIIMPIKAKYKNIQFVVEQSKRSNSLYLYLTMQETVISLRISDHKNEIPFHKYQLIVSPKMTTKKIYDKIDRLCQEMSIKRRYYLLKKIETEKEVKTSVRTFNNWRV